MDDIDDIGWVLNVLLQQGLLFTVDGPATQPQIIALSGGNKSTESFPKSPTHARAVKQNNLDIPGSSMTMLLYYQHNLR